MTALAYRREDVAWPGVEATGGCESPHADARSQLRSSARTHTLLTAEPSLSPASTLKHFYFTS